MKLSKNFSLDEFLVSQTAARNSIDMTPSPLVVDNLRLLVEGCLQPIRDHARRPIFISSGYRPLELNTRIGGSATSAHLSGNAADIVISGMTPYDACTLILSLDIAFDQMINEFDQWVHLGVGHALRGETMTAVRRKGHTRYEMGIQHLEHLA